MSHLKTYSTSQNEEKISLPELKYNKYLHDLINPFGAIGARIPDINITPLIPKMISYNTTWTAATGEIYMLVFLPHSKGQTTSLYKYDTNTSKFYFSNFIVPNEVLSDDFSAVRSVTGAYILSSDTISSTNATLSGKIDSISFGDMPELSKVSLTNLSAFKRDESSQALNIKLATGIVANAEPSTEFGLLPLNTNAVSSVDTILDAFVQSSAIPVEKGFMTYSFPNLPINLWGKFDLISELTSVMLTSTGSTLITVTCAGNEWSGNTLIPVIQQRSYMKYFVANQPDCVTLNSHFDTNWTVDNITVQISAPVGSYSYFQLELISNDYYSQNSHSNGVISLISGVSSGQVISYNAVIHYEVQPDYLLTKNVPTSYDKSIESFLDIKVAQLVFGNKELFGIKSIYPLDDYKSRNSSEFFMKIASSSFSKYFASDNVVDKIKMYGKTLLPLLSGALSLYNPLIGSTVQTIGNGFFAKSNHSQSKFEAGSYSTDDMPTYWPPLEINKMKFKRQSKKLKKDKDLKFTESEEEIIIEKGKRERKK